MLPWEVSLMLIFQTFFANHAQKVLKKIQFNNNHYEPVIFKVFKIFRDSRKLTRVHQKYNI